MIAFEETFGFVFEAFSYFFVGDELLVFIAVRRFVIGIESQISRVQKQRPEIFDVVIFLIAVAKEALAAVNIDSPFTKVSICSTCSGLMYPMYSSMTALPLVFSQ